MRKTKPISYGRKLNQGMIVCINGRSNLIGKWQPNGSEGKSKKGFTINAELELFNPLYHLTSGPTALRTFRTRTEKNSIDVKFADNY